MRTINSSITLKLLEFAVEGLLVVYVFVASRASALAYSFCNMKASATYLLTEERPEQGFFERKRFPSP